MNDTEPIAWERAILERKSDGEWVRVFCARDFQFYIDKPDPNSRFVNLKERTIYLWDLDAMPSKVVAVCGAEEERGYKVVWRERDGEEPRRG